MRILMLGWEFDPFVSGGLGVACRGLVRALDQLGHEVVFILPRPVDAGNPSARSRLLGPESLPRATDPGPPAATARPGDAGHATASLPAIHPTPPIGPALPDLRHATFHAVEALFAHSYPSFEPSPLATPATAAGVAAPGLAPSTAHAPGPLTPAPGSSAPPAPVSDRVGFVADLIDDAERYARLVVALASREKFDVIHAHDWLTFPAAIAVARVSGKPFVAHVHSTEFDRAGNAINQRIFDAERAGMHAAARVIAVSEFTRSVCMRRYGIDADRIDVVYNGIDREAAQPRAGARVASGDKIVLFLGRITMQKGPEYFIAAAKRVLEKVKGVKFVLAGSGDMAVRMIELASNMGIGDHVLFTGFLREGDVRRIYDVADCYVMPSVSEPFGLAALEAVRHDVPTIVSRTSGVSEVLQHVLKVDFWDIEEIANKIIAVLTHPALGETLRVHGSMELDRLTWESAARKSLESYARALAPAPPAEPLVPHAPRRHPERRRTP